MYVICPALDTHHGCFVSGRRFALIPTRFCGTWHQLLFVTIQGYSNYFSLVTATIVVINRHTLVPGPDGQELPSDCQQTTVSQEKFPGNVVGTSKGKLLMFFQIFLLLGG